MIFYLILERICWWRSSTCFRPSLSCWFTAINYSTFLAFASCYRQPVSSLASEVVIYFWVFVWASHSFFDAYPEVDFWSFNWPPDNLHNMAKDSLNYRVILAIFLWYYFYWCSNSVQVFSTISLVASNNLLDYLTFLYLILI